MEKSLFLYKSYFHWQSNAFLWLDFQTHGFSYHCKEIKIGVMFSSLRKAKKKITTRGLFISTLSHVKLIAETRHHIICYKNMKSMGIFALQFFESFRGKIYKIFSTGNEEWFEFDIAKITSHSALHNHLSFHKLTCRQNKCTPKKQTILSFFFTSKRYRNFS